MYESEWQTTCPDCGVTHYREEPCPYCYEVVDLHKVTFRGKTLARFHGDDGYDLAWAKWDALREAGRKGIKLETVRDATITRCEAHPYEG